MQGHVRLITHHPAIVGHRRDIEEITLLEFDDPSVSEGCSGSTGDDESHVLHRAALLTEIPTDVLGPFPAGLVSRAPEGHAAEAYYLEAALLEYPGLIGLLEPLQDHIHVHTLPSVVCHSSGTIFHLLRQVSCASFPVLDVPDGRHSDEPAVASVEDWDDIPADAFSDW